jgi:hypothetical protein
MTLKAIDYTEFCLIIRNRITIGVHSRKTEEREAKHMEESCLCMVIDDDDRVLCVQDESCCEEIRQNLEPYEC